MGHKTFGSEIPFRGGRRVIRGIRPEVRASRTMWLRRWMGKSMGNKPTRLIPLLKSYEIIMNIMNHEHQLVLCIDRVHFKRRGCCQGSVPGSMKAPVPRVRRPSEPKMDHLQSAASNQQFKHPSLHRVL